MSKIFGYIIIGLLAIVIIQGYFNTDTGLTMEDVDYHIKIHDLQQEKAELIRKNHDLELKIKSFKDEILKNDTAISGYNNNQIDSFYTDYFNR